MNVWKKIGNCTIVELILSIKTTISISEITATLPKVINVKKVTLLICIVIVLTLAINETTAQLPPDGYNKVAYYTFDATPVQQDFMSLTNFTDNANIVVVFEGTLWELADTVHYDTKWMRNRIYTSKKQILNDIRILQERGLLVLMNVDDAASWSTETPFTTWNGKKLDSRAFTAFVDSCVNVVGFDGIALDVEHKAVDNTHYRNLIKAFGDYFGPLSGDSLSKMYIAAIYNSQYGVPGEIFREEELTCYLNFVMDMGYHHDNTTRFHFWADPLGTEKVMLGMSFDDNSLESAVDWISRHPAPQTPGIMVYAGNVNKTYTDSIFSALGQPPVVTQHKRFQETNKHQIRYTSAKASFHISLQSDAFITIKLISINGKLLKKIVERRYPAGEYCITLNKLRRNDGNIAKGCYYAVITENNTTTSMPLIFIP